MEVNQGLNIFAVDKGSLESAPKEVRFMAALSQDIVCNTVRKCREEDMNPSLLPSAYLEAFKLFFPSLLQTIKEDGDGSTDDFIDAQIMTLNVVIDLLEKSKDKK